MPPNCSSDALGFGSPPVGLAKFSKFPYFSLTCTVACVSGLSVVGGAPHTGEKFSHHQPVAAFFAMKRETRRMIRELAYYSSLGLQVSLSIFLGLFAGILLDRFFDTHPWLMLVFLMLGIAAGFRNIGLAIKKSRNL
jgi:ATP synthase protein I